MRFKTETLILLFSTSLHAAIFNVSVAGSDSSSGVTNEPFATIGKAFLSVSPGDTIFLEDGPFTASAVTYTHGKEEKKITIIGASTNVAITGRLTIGHSYYVLDSVWIKDNYMELTGAASNSNILKNLLVSGGTQGIYMKWPVRDELGTNGPNFNVVSNCTFTAMSGDGCIVLSGTSNIVTRNLFWDTGGRDALRVWGYRNQIYSNTFNRILSGSDLGTTYHADIVQTFDSATGTNRFSKEIRFFNNYITNCTGQLGNIEAKSGSTNICDWEFFNNVFVNSRIQINIGVPGFKFFNNTVYNAPYSSGFRFSNGAHNGRVINNIFCRVGSGVDGSGFYSSKSENTNFVADYNIITDFDDTGHTAPNEGANGINGGYSPPQIFIDHSSGNLRLAKGSPAINSGYYLGAYFTTDFLNKSRSVWDIGAFERTSIKTPINLQSHFHAASPDKL